MTEIREKLLRLLCMDSHGRPLAGNRKVTVHKIRAVLDELLPENCPAEGEKLISADRFLERMKGTNRYFSLLYDVEEEPAVDAKPVEHGHWEYKHRHFGGFRECTGITKDGECIDVTVDDRWEEDKPYCSICGRFTEEIPDPEYCPHCGAKMNGTNFPERMKETK